MTGTGLPLDGVRVIEMTHMVMGPTCGMILAQLGAEVIKVEPPQGDKTRSLGGMGVSFFPGRDVNEPADLLRVAARALERAREEGPGRICLFQHQSYLFQPKAK